MDEHADHRLDEDKEVAYDGDDLECDDRLVVVDGEDCDEVSSVVHVQGDDRDLTGHVEEVEDTKSLTLNTYLNDLGVRTSSSISPCTPMESKGGVFTQMFMCPSVVGHNVTMLVEKQDGHVSVVFSTPVKATAGSTRMVITGVRVRVMGEVTISFLDRLVAIMREEEQGDEEQTVRDRILVLAGRERSMVMSSIQESGRKMLEDVGGTDAPGDWEEMGPVYHATLRDLIKCVSALSRVRADVSAAASGGMMGVSMSARDYSTSVLSTTQTPDMSVTNNMPPPSAGGMNVLPGRSQGRNPMMGGGGGGTVGVGGSMMGGAGPMSSSLRAMPAGGRPGVTRNSNTPQTAEKVVVRRKKKVVSVKSSSATSVPLSESRSSVGSSKDIGGPAGTHTVRRVKRRDPPADVPLVGVVAEVKPSIPRPPPTVSPPVVTEPTVSSSPRDEGMDGQEEREDGHEDGHEDDVDDQLGDETQEAPSNNDGPEEEEEEEEKDDYDDEDDTTAGEEVRASGDAQHEGYAMGEVRDTAGGDHDELNPRTVPDEWEDRVGASPEMQRDVTYQSPLSRPPAAMVRTPQSSPPASTSNVQRRSPVTTPVSAGGTARKKKVKGGSVAQGGRSPGASPPMRGQRR
eukprot:g5982.t1